MAERHPRRPPRTHIALLRVNKGFSQKELARAVGLPRSHTSIADAERGEYTKPGLRKLLSDYFEYKEVTLFDKDGFAREYPHELTLQWVSSRK